MVCQGSLPSIEAAAHCARLSRLRRSALAAVFAVVPACAGAEPAAIAASGALDPTTDALWGFADSAQASDIPMVPALIQGFLPVAVMAGITATVPKPRKLVECRSAADCGRPPIRITVIGERSNPFGPIDSQGWAMFGSIANQRYYTFPSTEKHAGRTWSDEWRWGGGIQLDTRRLLADEPSSRELFVLTEVGAGFDDHDDDSPYQLRTRLIIGRGGPGAMLYAIGEVGVGSGDPASGGGGDLYGRAALGLRF
jgi:hypothetical protein